MFGHACRCLGTPAGGQARPPRGEHAYRRSDTPAKGRTHRRWSDTRLWTDTPTKGWARLPMDGHACQPHQREEGDPCADAVSKRLWREDGIRIDRVATDYRPIPSRHRAFPYGDFKRRRQRTRVRLVALEWRQYTVERKVTRNVHFAQNRSFHPLSRLHEHGTRCRGNRSGWRVVRPC